MSSAADRLVVADQGTTVFDRYRITRHLYSDARGECYLADPIEGGRPVEVRILSHPALRGSAEALWQSIGDGVVRVACIDHPDVERVVSAGVADFAGESFVCVIAEHVVGETLHTRLRERRRLPTAEALVIGQRIALGLAALHDQGIVHGDLRPSRIALSRASTGDETVVLCDVGVNNLILNALRDSPALLDIFGPDFVAPEQIEGEPASFATDLYAFGLVLYRMLAGGSPFVARSTREFLVAQLSTAPTSLRERSADLNLPASVDALVLRCLEKRPSDRYESTQALLQALLDAQRDCEAPSSPRSFFGPSAERSPGPSEVSRASRPPPSNSGLLRANVVQAALRSSVPPATRPPSLRVEPPQPSMPAPSRTAAYAIAEIRREVASWKRWFLVAVVFTLSCGLVGGFVLAARKPSAPMQAVGVQALAPTNIRLQVRSNTPGAVVTVRGRAYPVPLRIELPPGTTSEMLEVTAEGRAPRRVWMMLDCNSEAQIDLLDPPPAEPTVVASQDEAPDAAAVAPDPVASLNVAVVRRVILEHAGDVEACINRARTRNPSLGGSVPVTIVIDSTGVAKRATWSSMDPTQTRALGCITHAIRHWPFPASNTGGDFVTVYAFDLDGQS